MTTSLTPYLAFDGTTRDAFGFYETALGAKIQVMLRFVDMPASAAPAAPDEGSAGATPGGDFIPRRST